MGMRRAAVGAAAIIIPLTGGASAAEERLGRIISTRSAKKGETHSIPRRT